jgi:hypothetical protein
MLKPYYSVKYAMVFTKDLLVLLTTQLCDIGISRMKLLLLPSAVFTHYVKTPERDA